ncbi:MAG: hypothetical protein DHS20C14_20990 [Phycisphaeraceae bacterium]|nr:MAG: hypothetical protein DHS20C14_20990 [Phycisphaeraceae bacterium]
MGAVGGKHAADQFLRNAPAVGIDLNMMFATMSDASEGATRVRQLCLAVPGSGRTAMLFMAPPGEPGEVGDLATQASERVRAVSAALEGLEKAGTGDDGRALFVLAQALPEPGEVWAIRALESAGMTRVGELAYLSLRTGALDDLPEPGPLPEGVSVEPVGDLDDPVRHAALARALERSYVDTLDCPALCGVRETDDVIASHRSTGRFDPNRWWIIARDGSPEGCCLMTHCPEHRSVELVYIGISPALRGAGIGANVLVRSLRAVRDIDAAEVTCAVDRANAPALAMYDALGFGTFSDRVAFIRPVRAPAG